ncbi:hypothetical protein LAZ40_02430 [Cereibacter sphaeroides]|uniref:hypothetical protein n=1 Tax=Cereibacter sphaeroides TaxID=1063 RepID=UPI001F1E3158|nr:hypothetical protein [Cereibacter sphaeroides]MCE6957915.1 hypothetical protein [Cereibacter sphaeroides]MCE6971737.1 hypothetical protein [Cereibacter sphaeroides]
MKSCTNGQPRKVDSPAFTVTGRPEGTETIEVRLKDLEAPRYNHGRGSVAVTANGTVAPGAFRYASPCPPSGRHTYEWTATAKTGKADGNRKLGIAKARKTYPE